MLRRGATQPREMLRSRACPRSSPVARLRDTRREKDLCARSHTFDLVEGRPHLGRIRQRNRFHIECADVRRHSANDDTNYGQGRVHVFVDDRYWHSCIMTVGCDNYVAVLSGARRLPTR